MTETTARGAREVRAVFSSSCGLIYNLQRHVLSPNTWTCLLSQLSFSVYAGQVVFRGALRQDGDRELGDRETFLTSLFFASLVLFSVSLGLFLLAYSSRVRGGAQQAAASRLPLFCLSVSEAEGSVGSSGGARLDLKS